MSEYIIKCPVCGKKFKVTAQDPSTLGKKTFTCTDCRFTAPFTTLIKELAEPQPITRADDNSQRVMPNNGHNPTRVNVNTVGPSARAFLTILGTSSRFVLNQGAYILGRKSSDSKATLQLAPDISMSRQHARLAVQMVNGKTMAQIVGLKANNPIFINGKIIPAGQPHTLRPGDELQLGMTKMAFSI